MTYSVLIAAPFLIAAIVMAVRFVGCTEDFGQFEQQPGDGTEGPPKVQTVMAKATLSGSGQLSADASFPSHPENDAPPPFTAAGAYTYEIPYWCSSIDVLLLGAGGGGASGVPVGAGGLGGTWTPVTYWRGFGTRPPGSLEISAATTSISITVGAGGIAGTPDPGGATIASVAGQQDQTAPGGAAGANSDATGTGPNPHTQISNNQPVTGGDDQTTPGDPGNSPGGGGAGGFFTAGTGADGAAWVVARQT